ncbi:MAG: hypothetical protein HY906_06975 [Deltaproteobacteria bacterium]|nr:hypothetical protein [Deltaproteobacteria bacterium]
MSTWVAAVVETAGRADFWEIARNHGVQATIADVPKYALIECDAGFDFQASVRLAEALSRDLGTTSLGFVVQTNADVHELHAFSSGPAVRRLAYSRDSGGWLQVEGTAQPWERAYFFDEAGSTKTDDSGRWPDMLWDDLSDEDLARYEAAKAAGDPATVMDWMHPSSTAPMHRVCGFLGIHADRPAGSWRKPSLWSRVFGRG